jgi:broad specificity phosphatase PhoE
VKLILVRHGETQDNAEGRVLGWGGPGLNQRGRNQAEAAARALSARVMSDNTVAAMYSSPLPRAMETAERISRELDLPVQEEESLAEIDAGKLEGLTGDEMRAQYPELMDMWGRDPGSVQMPDGESLGQLQERVWRVAQTLLERHLDDTVVVVSHNFPIEVLVCRVLDLPLAGIRLMRVDLGSLSTVDIQPERCRLVHLNDVCHLDGIDDSPGS